MTTPFMESQAMPYDLPETKVPQPEKTLEERSAEAQAARKRFLKESTIPAQDGFITLGD